jgi:hypothetical protein
VYTVGLVRGVLIAALAAALAACASAEQQPDGGDDGDDGDDATPPDASPDAAPDACVPAPGGEVCNGVDDDCNGMTDEGFPGVGEACNAGVGACFATGSTVCTADGSGVECDAVPGTPGTELCGNATDDDCDTETDEGFVTGGGCTAGVGACQAAGLVVCSADMLSTVCNAVPGMPMTEQCNGVDDNCDTVIDDGFGLGTGCDGTDGDACIEGIVTCDGAGGTTCTDMTSTTTEVCNGLDEDCDGVDDDGFDLTSDINNCGACGTVCTNPQGTTSCSASACAPVCNPGWVNCDANNPNGCELLRDDTPACATSLFTLAAVSGDTGAQVSTDSWYDEEWDRISITETNTSTIYLSARIELQSPPSVNFDLYVYCVSCGGTLIGQSTAGAGALDTVMYRHEDLTASDTRDLIIEIRYAGGTACGNWNLTVTGNPVAPAANHCP